MALNKGPRFSSTTVDPIVISDSDESDDEEEDDDDDETHRRGTRHKWCQDATPVVPELVLPGQEI